LLEEDRMHTRHHASCRRPWDSPPSVGKPTAAVTFASATRSPSGPGNRPGRWSPAYWAKWRSVRRALLIVVCFACATSANSTIIAPTPRKYDPDRHFLVYTGAKTLRLHAVVISADSVSGVSDSLAVACDHCRLSVAQADVDSIAIVAEPAGWRPPIAVQVAAVLLVLGGALFVH
jgi:hypothetical protein